MENLKINSNKNFGIVFFIVLFCLCCNIFTCSNIGAYITPTTGTDSDGDGWTTMGTDNDRDG